MEIILETLLYFKYVSLLFCRIKYGKFMNKLNSELTKDLKLYRELFINADKTFKELMKNLKSDFMCSKCRVCCRIRYSKLPPGEIYRLAKEENCEISKEYIKFFIPYGINGKFTYSCDCKISVELNNKLAQEVEERYVKTLLAKHDQTVYFYYCRFTDEDNNCLTIEKSFLCSEFPNSVSTILPQGCSFRHWQNYIAHKIKSEIEPDIILKIEEIIKYRENFQCKRTGICCRLACSEFSYQELLEKAKNGDNFAGQFTAIFAPYRDIEAAREVYSDYVDLVLSKIDESEKTNFYYCKHLINTNQCTIYENRPQICRDFPDNPLSIIPPVCGFYQWREEVIVAAYTFHAMSQIYSFYLNKIKEALS
jgi:Fe-S-cluster containining protein